MYIVNVMDENKIANRISKADIINKVFDTIQERKKNQNSDDSSYVSSLFRDGLEKIHEKIDEEAAESIEASQNGDKEKIIYEYTDLLFHMMVGLSFQNITMEDIYSELERRIGKKKTDYTLDE
jgi:phosphoribosyl-ATP pyrophosphohydrolase|tara:strand:- start:11159 stop:11527 length:369 start_codon:yes stop_codon:yes gene_type:complete